MLGTVITAIVAFIVTNIDDLLIDAVLFAQADSKYKTKAVVAGKYTGIGFITLASCLCAVVLQTVVNKYISLLGIVPIILGVKMWLDKDKAEDTADISDSKNLIFTVFLVTISQSGDNLGIYIPLFASFDITQFVITFVVFALCIGLWCALAKSISNLPLLKNILLKHKDIIVPIVLVLLGLSILLGY